MLTYRYVQQQQQQHQGHALQLLHSIDVDDVPLAIAELKGMVLIGIGKRLCLYDFGLKQLLKKAECPQQLPGYPHAGRC